MILTDKKIFILFVQLTFKWQSNEWFKMIPFLNVSDSLL